MERSQFLNLIKEELIQKLQESADILDSQPESEFDYEDAVGNFWLVKRAMNESTDDELMCETDVFGLAEMISKGLTKENIAGLYKSEGKARSSSKRALRQRKSQLKEDIKTASQKLKDLKEKITVIKADIATKTDYATNNPGSRDAISADLEKLYSKLTKLEDLQKRLDASLGAEKAKKKQSQEPKKDVESETPGTFLIAVLIFCLIISSPIFLNGKGSIFICNLFL